MTYNIDLIHKPVMLNEVLDYLQPKEGDVIIDGTFGAGGYSNAILNNVNCSVIGIDRDPDVESFVNNTKSNFGERFRFIKGCFSKTASLMEDNNIPKVNGLVLDLGVSSMQLEKGSRGFSFNQDAELDMRMGKDGICAKEIINSAGEKELADIIYNYGDERNSRKIAKQIVTERRKQPILTTKQLSFIIASVTKRSGKLDPATKTFQALRIYVNDELNEIKSILSSIELILAEGGRIVVVAFHSLEDRIVKNFLRDNKKKFHLLTKKVVKPTYQETRRNNRSRSAVLRAAIYTGT